MSEMTLWAGARDIRVAAREEFPRLREIEALADRMFAAIGMGPFTTVPEDDHLDQAAVVLVSGMPALGFACVDIVDGLAHLWQLSVDPAAGRQGRGSALLNNVCEWASARGLPAVTLTTFKDVSWNAPFYERLGFRVIEGLSSGLWAIREHEREIGDDTFGPRVAMRKEVR